ncbi:MAG: PAS domain S-box protein [Acidimicrobiales bacterium]
MGGGRRGATEAPSHPVAPTGDLRISSIEESIDADTDPYELAHALTGLALQAAATDDDTLERNLQMIVHHLPISIFSLDRDGILTSSYGGALRRLGVEDGELVGMDSAVFGPATVEAFQKVLSGDATSFDIEGVGVDGGRWVFHIVIAPLPDDAGAVAVSIDKTAQVEALEQAEHQRRLHESAVEALRDSEHRFRILAEYAPMGIFIADPERVPLYVNPAGLDIVGRSFDEVRSASWFSHVHDEDRDRVLAELAAQAGAPDLVAEFRVVRPDDSVRWIRQRAAVVRDDDGQIAGYVGTSADITEHVRAETALREREERFRAILETAAEGIVTVDETGLIAEFNAAAERIFGYDSDEVIGRMRAEDLLDEGQRDELIEGFAAYVAGERPRIEGMVPIEIDGISKSGEVVPLELALAQVDTSEGRLFTAVIRDISERKAFERELEHLATHDPLTGLPNRALLHAQLEASLARARRHRAPVAVLFIDLDRVKLVTEALGHRAGDELIVQVARRIEAVIDGSATLSRFSGDQFVVFSDELDDVADAVETATAIIEAVNDPFSVAGDDAF